MKQDNSFVRIDGPSGDEVREAGATDVITVDLSNLDPIGRVELAKTLLDYYKAWPE